MVTVKGQHGTYEHETKVLAAGGQAKVYEVLRQPHLVYKQFNTPFSSDVDRKRLRRLSVEGRRVFVKEKMSIGSTPESSILWPVDYVESTSGIEGIVLPRIPKSFFRPTGDNSLQFLYLRRANPPDLTVRVAILIRLAEVLGWLSANELVHGDINQKNYIWCTSPQPMGLLIDTDGIHSPNHTLDHPVFTPFWKDPRLTDQKIKQHDRQSDSYALCLAVYRTLFMTPGNLGKNFANNTWPKPRIHPRTPRAVGQVLHDALANPMDVSKRPAPLAVAQALAETFFPNGKTNDKALNTVRQISGEIPTPVSSPGKAPRTSGAQRASGPKPGAPSTSAFARPAPPKLGSLSKESLKRRGIQYCVASVLTLLVGFVSTGFAASTVGNYQFRLGDVVGAFVRYFFGGGFLWIAAAACLALVADMYAASTNTTSTKVWEPLPLMRMAVLGWLAACLVGSILFLNVEAPRLVVALLYVQPALAIAYARIAAVARDNRPWGISPSAAPLAATVPPIVVAVLLRMVLGSGSLWAWR